MADDSGDSRRQEELQKKIAEVKQKTLEEESKRIEAEVARKAETSLQNYRMKEGQAFQQQMQEAAENRRRAEAAVQERARELTAAFDEEGRKKSDLRRQLEEEHHRAQEEERRREEELARAKAEEEERLRREEELRRQEEAERLKIEAERRRREEEARRMELDRQRREEDQRRQEEERRERIRKQISEAQQYFDNSEYEHALVEVAKALVNDPANETALELDGKIRDILRTGKDAEPAAEQPKRQPKKVQRSMLRTPDKPPKKSYATAFFIVAGIVIIATAVLLLMKRQVFTSELKVAVVPWISPAATEDERQLGTALAAEVLRTLDKLPSVNVLGYSSAYNLALSRTDPQRAAFELGYHYVLRGTVTSNSQHTTVNVMLVDSIGRVAWTNTYDRPGALIASLPGDIATQLADAMKLSHPDGWAGRDAQIPPEAFREYLQGRAYVLKNTRADCDTALIHFRAALRSAASFTDALNGAADALLTMYEEGWNGSDTLLNRARQYSEAAIEADSTSGEGYCNLARVLAQRSMLPEAMNEFDNAVRRAPGLSTAWIGKAIVSFRLGQVTAAFDALQRASDTDPRNPAVNKTFAFLYQIARSQNSYARSLFYHGLVMSVMKDSTQYITRTLADAITADPELRLREGHRIVTACYRQLQAVPGDFVALYTLARLRQTMGNEEAESLLRTLQKMLQSELQQNPRNTTALMIMAKTLTRLGRFPEANDLAQKAIAIDTGNVNLKYNAAQIYALQMYSLRKKGIDQDRKDAAMQFLRRALSRSYRLEEIASADFYNMIDQPEFQSAIQPAPAAR